MSFAIKTNHLLLRSYAPTDAAAAFAWFGDPEVMRFVPYGPDASAASTLARVRGYIDHERRAGYAKGAIVDRESGSLIGDAGLMTLPATKETVLGFRLMREYWGRGLATEAAAAWLYCGFSHLHLEQIIAFSHRDSAASLRVLEKINVRFLREDTLFGMDVIVYVANKFDYASVASENVSTVVDMDTGA